MYPQRVKADTVVTFLFAVLLEMAKRERSALSHGCVTYCVIALRILYRNIVRSAKRSFVADVTESESDTNLYRFPTCRSPQRFLDPLRM